METAKRALALVAGREDALWAALDAAAVALVPSNGGKRQPVLYCHVVVETVTSLEQRLGAAGRSRRIFALESAVIRLADGVPCASASVEDNARLTPTDQWFFRSAFVRVMEEFLALTASQSGEARQLAMATVTRLGVLLSSVWLLDSRKENFPKATELLLASATLLQKHRDVEHLAAGPLFVLAMTSLAETAGKAKALELFRATAAVSKTHLEHADIDATPRGVLDYWFAVALFQNGLEDEAAATLQRCVRVNYEPVACLALTALLHLRALNFREAADDLQRAMEIDFAQSVSMFDYAVLLGRMGNFEGQFQMLEYFCESRQMNESTPGRGKKRQRDASSEEVEAASTTEAAMSSVVDAHQLNALIPCSLSRPTMRLVYLHLALAAMENGNWLESKRYFEEFFADHDGYLPSSGNTWEDECDVMRDYVYVLLQSHHFTLALSRVETFLAEKGAGADTKDDESAASLAMIHLYKADALLNLERIEVCYEYLSDTVAPLVTKLLSLSTPLIQDRRQKTMREEIVHCHTQLLNNLAVATVCQKGVDAGIELLRHALVEYPGTLSLAFNLVLLLWRNGKKEAACTLWIEARGWNLQMKMEDLPDEKELHNALAMTAPSEKAASAANATVISEHVSDFQDDCGVSKQQLVHLDALVLDHWKKIRNDEAVEKSILYVQYLEMIAKGTS